MWRGRPVNKKQGSDGIVTPEPIWCHDAKADLYSHYLENLDFYNHLILEGVAPEMARMVLPQSMLTSWWWSGSLDAFANMCALRCAPDAQYESRVVANQVSNEMSLLFPKSWEALMNA